MNKYEEISKLKELQLQIKQVSRAELDLNAAKEKLNMLYTKPYSAVKDFDAKNKNAFIMLRVGPEPEKPKGLKIGSKYKTMKMNYDTYIKRRNLIERQYYEENKYTREKVDAEEKNKRAIEIQQAEMETKEVNKRYQELVEKLNNNDVVSDKFKNEEAIAIFIEYFQDQRVDSIKEAINLYYEEEYRKYIETRLEEQISMIGDINEQIENIDRKSSEALEYAVDNIKKIEELERNIEEICGSVDNLQNDISYYSVRRED